MTRLARTIAEAVLRLGLGRRRADSVLGDLEEDLARPPGQSEARRFPGIWLVAQALTHAGAGWLDRRRSSGAGSPRHWEIAALARDARHAVRSLRAAPAFTTVALVVLTIGIGASTAIFSVVDAVVLRGLPFDEGDRIVSVNVRNLETGSIRSTNAAQDFLDWQRQQTVFSAFTAIAGGGTLTLREGGRAEQLRLSRVSADFFEVFRTQPRLGRPFTRAHEVDGNQRVALISDGLWRRRFGADPGVVGQTLTFDSGSWQVIGVMPRAFSYPVNSSEPTEIFVPFVVPPDQLQRGDNRSYYLRTYARLLDGVSIEQADAQLRTITAGLASAHPTWFTNSEAVVRSLHETLVGRVRSWMLMLLGAVGFVLLIACVNVANLMIARASVRERETRIRAALGASRWQIVRGVLVESVVLSAAGTACAVFMAWWSIDLLRAVLPDGLPRVSTVGIDLRVLTAAASMALLTGLTFGLVPALQSSRPNLGSTLRDGGRGTVGAARSGLRSTLVVVEVALAVVLLVGAGLFASSFVKLVNVDIGLDHRRVLTMGVYPARVGSDPASWQRAREQASAVLPSIVERVAALPGVESAGFISGGLPLSGSWSRSRVKRPGTDEFFDDGGIDVRQVTSGYADAVRARVIRGRYVEESDVASGLKVVVINEHAAARYFPDTDPLNQRLDIGEELVVVGVVADVRLGGPESEVRPEAYLPLAQSPVTGGELVIRSAGDPAAMADSVQAAISEVLPDFLPADVVTMESLLQRLIAQRQFNMLLVGLFGIVAMVIAAVGIYGVMAFLVAQRTQEIGVRMALGAMPGWITRMVLGRAVVLLTGGLVLGLAGAWVLASTVEGFLFEVEARDMSVYAVAGGVLILCGMLAALAPARRAARVDPLVALRSE